MGCSESREIPLQTIAAKRSMVINLSLTDNSSESNSHPISDLASYKRLALRMLVRYGNLIIFRSLYCSFKLWKRTKIGKLSISGISPRNISLTEDTINFTLFQTTLNKIHDLDISTNERFERIQFKLISKPCIDIIMFTDSPADKTKKIIKTFYKIKQKILIEPCSLVSDYCYVYERTDKTSRHSTTEVELAPMMRLVDKFPMNTHSPRRILNTRLTAPERFDNLIRSFTTKVSTLNPILSTLRTSEMKQAPFSIQQILKIFEELMDQKFALDRKELQDQIKPRELADFFPDYLNRNFGIQKVAQKMLNRLLHSLQCYATHPYISLFPRFLRIECQNPISINLLVFLCKARSDFNALILKKNSNLLKSGQLTDHKSFHELGGSATLSSVFTYIHQEFKCHEVFKEVFLKMCPNDLRFEEYCLFYTMCRISKQGHNLAALGIPEVIKLVSNSLGEYLMPEQMSSLTAFILKAENKVVQHFFTFAAHKKNIMTPRLWISKCEFLHALIEVYEFFKYRTLIFISETLQKYESLTKIHFYEAVQEIDPSFSYDFIDRIFQEAFQIDNQENISESTFTFLMIQYAVGCLSYFHLKSFNDAYKLRRVDYADLCIKPSDAFDLRSSIHRSKTLKK